MSATQNRFLSTLSESSRAVILSQSTEVPMPLRMPLYAAEQEPVFAYFLTSGMASIVATTEDGDSAEVGVIGREGFLGSLHLIGPAVVSTSAFMQLEGAGVRIPFSVMQSVYDTSGEIRNHVLEFVQQQTLIVSHIAACNRLHEAEARLARWLLMARDRAGTDTLDFTQEFLGMMLGARRTTVTLVASALQRLGLITYSRGRVKIVESMKLEEIACDCYQVIKHLSADLYRTGQR